MRLSCLFFTPQKKKSDKIVRTNLLMKSSVYKHCRSCEWEIYTIFTQNQKSSNTIIKILSESFTLPDRLKHIVRYWDTRS